MDFIREIIAEDLKSGKHETTITRFPPEPNGYLHIGHAKAICLSFGVAEENVATGATCNLRFDDTNPAKEELEYVESIKEDVSWLGFQWNGEPRFASNYFEYFYDCAVHLIKEAKAYVDEQSPEEMRKNRGDVITPGVASPYRDRGVDENLTRFKEMREGKLKEGEAVLRAKIDLSSSNMNMRDPALYRIMHEEHHNTGDSWMIYPMYDFAHPLEDAFEHITHSLCTLEFENHRPLYDWVVENCPVPSIPRQIEFARLSLTYTIMSKRKLLQLVQEKLVSGWDDPRMPTISGLRRRGYPPEAIRSFCNVIGITKQNSLTDVALLEYEVRNYLNVHAKRRMAVLNPLKLVITNWEEDKVEELDVVNNPNDENSGTRKVALAKEVWIEREDFMVDAPKKYFRLKPDGAVRLRGAYILVCKDYKTNSRGDVTEVHVEYIPDTVGKDAPEGIKCRAAIHWVSVQHGADAEVRIYDRLFTEEMPDSVEGGFLNCLNEDSLQVISSAKVEPSLANVASGDVCQFERLGYFCADNKEHDPGVNLVFNRTVALRDSWAKKSK